MDPRHAFKDKIDNFLMQTFMDTTFVPTNLDL